MKKKRALLNFIGICFVCAILVVLSVVSFTLPNSSDKYVGFLGAIDLGFEYQGGTKVTLKVENNVDEEVDFSKGVSAHSLRIQSILSNANYSSQAYGVAGKNIVVEVYDEATVDEVLTLINSESNNSLSMRAEDDLTATVYFTQKDIKDCYAMQTTSGYGIYIEFTEEGQENFKTLSTTASTSTQQVHIYLGDTLFKSISQVSETYDNSYVIIDGGSTQSTAAYGAASILATKYDFSFSPANSVVLTKAVAQRNLLLSAIITVVIVLACFIVLIARFKKLGLVNCLSLFIGILVQIIMLQAVPVMTLTATALLASVAIFVLGFVINYLMLDKIAKEYALGKKINSSLKFGYQKTFINVIEIFASVLVASIVFYIFGSVFVRYFAMGLIIGSIIYALCDLLVSKLFNKMCVNVVGNKPKAFGLRREDNVDELEEI